MSNLKKDSGFLSIIILLIVTIILGLVAVAALDVMGYIELPEEYSVAKYLDSSIETTYNAETFDTNKKVIKRRNTSSNQDEGNELEISNSVNSTEKHGNIDENSNSYKRFYYSQLENDSKKIYDRIMDNLDELKTGTYTLDFGTEFNELLNSNGGDEKLNNYFQSAVNAILLDNPEIFYLDITKMYLLTRSTTYAFTGTKYEVSIGPNDDESYIAKGIEAREIKYLESKISNIRYGIIRDLDEYNDYDKIKAVHDYLVENFEYDSTFSGSNIYNIYGALVNNLTVCEGYAKAFKYIMDELDIPCVVICGYAENSKGETENHAWNYVRLDNKWYAVDVTWDDPIVVGGGIASKDAKYKYFLKGANSLFTDHEEDGEIVGGVNFSYPNISKIDF